jgi:hypothetical protein
MQITLQIDSRDRGDVEDALKVVQSLREGLKLTCSASSGQPVGHPTSPPSRG